MNHDFVRARRRPRSTPRERAAWVRRYLDSGLSQRTFADQHRLGLSSLRKWIGQHRGEAGAASEGLPGWHEVRLPAAAGPVRWAAELVRPDGVVLRVASEASPAWVGALLRAGPC